jgi:hypothetical protein
LVQAALFGLCPQLRRAHPVRRGGEFAPRCRACALDFGQFNVGDGPAAFLTLIIGALVTGLALVAGTSGASRRSGSTSCCGCRWCRIDCDLGPARRQGALLAAEYRRQAREATGEDVQKP